MSIAEAAEDPLCRSFAPVENEWYFVALSEFGGHGAFARKRIPAGQAWWKPCIGVNVLETSRAMYCALQQSHRDGSEMSEKFWNGFVTYSYYQGFRDSNWLILDNGRFVNHSTTPNSKVNLETGESVALRDIEEGEEIFENYHNFALCPWPEDVDGFPDKLVSDDPRHRAACAEYMKTHAVDPVPPTPLKTEEVAVKPAEHGVGLFATKSMERGTLIWEPTVANHLYINREAYTTLVRSQQNDTTRGLIEALKHYSIYAPTRDSLVMNIDNARFFNHSDNANCITDETTLNTILKDDVKPGDELTDNYHQYPECPWVELAWESKVGYARKVPASLDAPGALPHPRN